MAGIMGSSLGSARYPHLLLSAQIRILNRIYRKSAERILHVIQITLPAALRNAHKQKG